MADDQFDVADELEGTVDDDESPMLTLVDIWDSSREPFDEWVEVVSRAFYESEFGIEAAAQLLDTSPGELAAVLSLATMEDECLELLNEEIPPKTTWFALAEASKEEVEIAMEALQDMSSDESPHSVVKRAIREHRGPTPEERVAELPGEVFFHMATKAKQYDLLYGKARSFLFDIGKYRSAGSELSPKQADWAHDLLKQMADQGAISRDSPDDDQEECDMVLDALGR
jgi:nitrogen fixation-related uncharacterized protein